MANYFLVKCLESSLYVYLYNACNLSITTLGIRFYNALYRYFPKSISFFSSLRDGTLFPPRWYTFPSAEGKNFLFVQFRLWILPISLMVGITFRSDKTKKR